MWHGGTYRSHSSSSGHSRRRTSSNGARVEVAILEVGLGGRLDAVNAFEPNVSLITAVGVDHRAWLGDDRESVGREKAGIMRTAVPCVIGERAPPASVVDHAHAIGTPCRILGRDYGFRHGPDHWTWWGDGRTVEGLPPPGLLGLHQVDNAAACLSALSSLSPRVELGDDAVRSGIANARIPGRLEWLEAPERVLVDVAHNPLGAEALGRLSGVVSPPTEASCGVRRPRRQGRRRHASCAAIGNRTRGTSPRCPARAAVTRTNWPESSPARCPVWRSIRWKPRSKPRSKVGASSKRSWSSARS